MEDPELPGEIFLLFLLRALKKKEGWRIRSSQERCPSWFWSEAIRKRNSLRISIRDSLNSSKGFFQELFTDSSEQFGWRLVSLSLSLCLFRCPVFLLLLYTGRQGKSKRQNGRKDNDFSENLPKEHSKELCKDFSQEFPEDLSQEIFIELSNDCFRECSKESSK